MNGHHGQVEGSCGGAGLEAVGPAGQPVGLLAKLMAVVRPQFRAEDLVFDPRDPVFGGPACAVPECTRPARLRGLCYGHHRRWRWEGAPDPAVFAATTTPAWCGYSTLSSCAVPDCSYGLQSNGLCVRHTRQWDRAGRPDLSGWLASSLPRPAPTPPPAICRIDNCDLWVNGGTSMFCHAHTLRWRRWGRPDVEAFAATYAYTRHRGEHLDLRCLPTQLRLEIAYVLQCRQEEATAKLLPATVQLIVYALAGAGVSSLLEHPETHWTAHGMLKTRPHGSRAFVLDAYRRIEALAIGQGWDIEYPRQVWRLRNLGINEPNANIDFTGIPQPWLNALVKRWARWQLTTGLSASTTTTGVRAITRFAAFLTQTGVNHLTDVNRSLLERYLAVLHTELAGRAHHHEHISALGRLLRAIRQHGWDDTLPKDAQLFTEDYPRCGQRLPRALAANVMAQVERPANLDRWRDPTYRAITLVLIRAGLRISSSVTLPFDCIVTDADAAPYLRYYNTKMKREALVPIDTELHREIVAQQQRTLGDC